MSIISAGTSNTSTLVYTGDTTGNLAFQTNGTNERMRITSGGFVGIGETNPTHRLHVAGNSGAEVKVTRGTNDCVISLSNNIGGVVYIGPTVASPLVLQTNNTEYMRIDTSGNVGIGVTPTSKLHISGSGSTCRIRIDNTVSGRPAAIAYDDSQNLTISNFSDSGYIGFVNGTGNGTERMRITSGGYLKASDNGTYFSSTGVYHELMQSRVDSYALRVGITASSGGGYPMQLCWTTQTNNNTTDRYLTCSDATSTKMQVFSNGNIQNQNGSYGTISDIKNKENIVDATPKLEKIVQLKVRNFNLKDDKTKLKQIGFIAQEFEKVFPSMIEESPDMDIDGNKTGETTKAIKTSVLIPILVKAIQELKAELDATKAEVAALKGNN